MIILDKRALEYRLTAAEALEIGKYDKDLAELEKFKVELRKAREFAKKHKITLA